VRGEKVPKSGAFDFPRKEAKLPQVNASGLERERGMQIGAVVEIDDIGARSRCGRGRGRGFRASALLPLRLGNFLSRIR